MRYKIAAVNKKKEEAKNGNIEEELEGKAENERKMMICNNNRRFVALCVSEPDCI